MLVSVSVVCRPAESLEVLYLRNNPAASAVDYRSRVLACCPKLIQLDEDDVVR